MHQSFRFFLLVFLSAKVLAQPSPLTISVVSPNGAIKTTIDLNAHGELHYNVTSTRNGTTVEALPESSLGILISNADFSRELTYTGLVNERKILDHYRMIHGKRADCHNEATEKTFRFSTKAG